MNRTIDARCVRRAWVLICAACAILTIAIALMARGRSARAETAASAPAIQPAPGAAISSTNASPPAAPADHDASRSSPAAPPLPTARTLLHTATGGRVFAYPPLPSSAAPAAPAPVVMMLHGMCGDPRLACDFWSDAGREGSWLVCPAGNARCGDWDDWKGTPAEKAASLDQALEALDRAYPTAVVHAGRDVLIGFSRGAFVARDVAYERPGRYRALILIGASMTPDAARLKASGVRRVVMAAGDYDGARPTMQRAARALDAAGLPTRYVSLGPIPHTLPANLADHLRAALAWIREDTPA